MAISENNEIRSNLLQCPLDNNDKIFFTLMDHLNNLFTSKHPKDILRFYDSFENRDQLIKWMRERPKGNYRIVEFNKEENDIIVVIPTIDVNGKFAKTCREEIFKGLHIIFVESGGFKDYYLNIAHCNNLGFKKAMEYNPKWIIWSGDDMYKIDDVEVLKNELLNINNKDYDVVFTQPSIYHSIPDNIGKENILRKIGFTLIPKRRMQKKIEKKFKVTLFPAPVHSYYRFFYKPGYRYISYADFCIFSCSFVREKKGELFNEDLIYGEDNDLSLKISLKRDRYIFINYKIGDYMGQSLGSDILRKLRNEIGLVLLNYMIDKNLHPASEEIKKYI